MAVSGLNRVYERFFYIFDYEYEMEEGLTPVSRPKSNVYIVRFFSMFYTYL